MFRRLAAAPSRVGRPLAASSSSPLRRSLFSQACQRLTASGARADRSKGYLALSLGAGLAFAIYSSQQQADCAATDNKEAKKWPQYSREEVAKHKTKETGVWVTYQDGVYDITNFIAKHPGGAVRISMAAGGALEPFWSTYRQHQNAELRKILEEYRIGTLIGGAANAPAVAMADPYASDPERHPSLRVVQKAPFNAETPLPLLADNFITPNNLFFVRNHLPVPIVDPKSYQLEIQGEGVKLVKLSLDDLKSQFPRHVVTATMQCTGNRRSDMNKVKPVKGLDWGPAAISNAEWSGARLSDVLKYAGLHNAKAAGVEHVQFEGLDADASGAYAASIPIQTAMDLDQEVILAYEMNGEPLPADHGYPVRVVAPGITGARQVKWLKKVITSPQESPSLWQQKDYRSFSPSTDWDTVDFSTAPSIYDTPVQSAITEPCEGHVVDRNDGEVSLKGYAFSGAGRPIIRVDVSADEGRSWHTAELGQDWRGGKKAWGWTLWTATVPLPKNQTNVELICKATDTGYNTQPERPAGIWNLRGVLTNSWHRVHIKTEEPAPK